MKISENTKFQHPVLAPWLNDLAGYNFDVLLRKAEDEASNSLHIDCEASMDQPEILGLLETGTAKFGVLVRCVETGYRRVLALGFPRGVHEFARGALMGRVQIRPMIWLSSDLDGYSPSGRRKEFEGVVNLNSGQILALDEEYVIDVSRPPLPSIESLFELRVASHVEDGLFDIDLNSDKVIIDVSEAMFNVIQSVRSGSTTGVGNIENLLYSQIIAHLLHEIEARDAELQGYRWCIALKATVEYHGWEIKGSCQMSLAQVIMKKPLLAIESHHAAEGEL